MVCFLLRKKSYKKGLFNIETYEEISAELSDVSFCIAFSDTAITYNKVDINKYLEATLFSRNLVWILQNVTDLLLNMNF